jgi:hypothetical protein
MMIFDRPRFEIDKETRGGEPSSLSEILDTTIESERLGHSSIGKAVAIDRAYDDRIDAVKKATGTELKNPMSEAQDPRDVYYPPVVNMEPVDDGTPSPIKPRYDPEALFRKELSDLAEKHPEQRSIIAPDRSVLDDAKGLTRAAEKRAAETWERSDKGMAAWGARLGGGFYAGMHDPVNIGTLAVGGGPAGLGVRGLAWMALKQAAANAGAEAAIQPFVQAWRKEAGLDYGISQAALDIGMAGAFGGGLDLGVRSIARGFRHAIGKPYLGPNATPLDALDQAAKSAPSDSPLRKAADGDPEALRELAKQMGDEPVIRAAADEIETQSLFPAPEKMDDGEHLSNLAKAIREESGAPELPAGDGLIPAMTRQVADLADEAEGRAVTVEGKPVGFRSLDPKEVTADAAQFQFKSGGDLAGVTDRLRGVSKWDPVSAGKAIVFERADGQMVIADGHQRLGLAQRLSSEGQDAKIDAYVFRESDGWTPEDVRAYAALKNMRESSGNSVDMSRVMRERPDLIDGSLPLSDAKLREAAMLSRLSNPAFDAVVAGRLPPSFAALIGESVPDPARHAGLLDELAAANLQTLQQARLYLKQLLELPTTTETQMTLFGEESFTRTVLLERTKVLDAALRSLRTDKRIFSLLDRQAGAIEGAGNVLAREANAAKADNAAQLADLIEKLATSRGTVATILNDAAASVARGYSPTLASRAFVSRIGDILEKEGINGLVRDLEAPEPELLPRGMEEPNGPEAKAQTEELESQIDANQMSLDLLARPNTPINPVLAEIDARAQMTRDLVDGLGLKGAHALVDGDAGGAAKAEALRNGRLLMEAIGFPPEVLGQGKKLTLYVGSNSVSSDGGFRPDRGEIRISRNASSQIMTMAHEWWHFLDNYFSTIDAAPADTFMSQRLTRAAPDIGANARAEVADAFDRLHALILDPESGMAKRAAADRRSAYMSAPEEMGSRAFQNYVAAKLGIDIGDKSAPYLLDGQQRADVFKAFDDLFAAIKVRDTDYGPSMFALKASLRNSTLSESATDQMASIRSEIDKAVSRALPVGWRADVRQRLVFGDLPESLRKRNPGVPPSLEIEGTFDPYERIIYVSMAALDPVERTFEEAGHALKALKLVPDADYAILQAKAKEIGARERFRIDERYGEIYGARWKDDPARLESALEEEAIMQMVAARARGESFDKPVNSILDKLLRFFKAVKDMLGLKGFRGFEDVFSDMMEGGFARAGDGEAARFDAASEVMAAIGKKPESSKVQAEPPVPAGKVRVYHSGAPLSVTGAGPRWVSTNRQYAKDYRAGEPLHYLDLDASDPRVNNADYPDQGVAQGFQFNFELPEAEASLLRQIADPDSPALPGGAGAQGTKPNKASGESAKPRPLSPKAEAKRIRDLINASASEGKLSREDADALISRFDALEKQHKDPKKAKDQLAEEIDAEAADRKRKAALQEVARLNVMGWMTTFRDARGQPDPAKAMIAIQENLAQHELPAGMVSVANQAHAIFGMSLSELDNMLHEFRKTTITGQTRNKARLSNVVRELFGEGTGDKSAAEFAKASADVMEKLRQRFNAAGGAIGKRDDWGLPQSHDPIAMNSAGKEAWTAYITPLLDAEKMKHPLTGNPMMPDDLKASLSWIYDNLVSDGWHEKQPSMGFRGLGSVANQRGESRFLIFKDADSWIRYSDQFGAGPDPLAVIVNHIKGMSEDIAAMEVLGPNPRAMLTYMQQFVEKQAALRAAKMPAVFPVKTEVTGRDFAANGKWLARDPREYARRMTERSNNMWDFYRGATGAQPGDKLAEISQTVRNWNVFTKLGSAFVSATGDIFWQVAARKFAGLPVTKTISHVLREVAPGGEREARRAGVIAESYLHMHNESAREGAGLSATKISGYLADRVVSLSMLNGLTRAGNHAMVMGIQSHLADQVGKSFRELAYPIQRLLRRHGLGEADWDAIRMNAGDADFLTPTAIYDRLKANGGDTRIAERYLAMTLAEAQYATATGTLRAKAMALGNTRAGTGVGELWRHLAQFKSFAVNIAILQIERIAREFVSQGLWRGAQYGAFALVSATMGGALVVQLKQLLAGKDPRDMTKPEFWGQAAYQSGGLGIWGDLLSASENRMGGGIAGTIAGPTASTVQDLVNLTYGSAKKSLVGKPDEKTNIGRELAKTIRTSTPGASLWYVKLAWNRVLMDNLQRMMDPEADAAFRRQMQRAKKDYRQDWFWKPGQASPSRAPNLGAAIQAR